MEVQTVRWEIAVIQHLMFHQMNLELEEEASATVVAAAAKSSVQSHHWKMLQ